LLVTRLGDAGIVNLEWAEGENIVWAEGHQSYEIDENNEIATFVGEKCVSIREAADFPHAVSMVLASEAVIAFEIREKARRAT
jgi:hypothetical protein